MYANSIPMQYTTRSVSGTEFLIRLLTGLAMLACIGNALFILTGRVDMVSWFTGFTVFNRDALGLFVAYAAAGIFFAAITFKWLRFLWWVAIFLAASLFYAGWGIYYGNTAKDSGPSMMDTLSHKFNFENIKTIAGSTVPASGGAPAPVSAPIQHIQPVTGTVNQTVTQSAGKLTNAQQQAAAAHKKAANTHIARLKQKGFKWQRNLNVQEKKWCANKKERAAYKAKYNRATPAVRAKENLKPEWLVEGRCVTGVLWEK